MTVDWFGDRAVIIRTDGPQSRERVSRMLHHRGEDLGSRVVVRRGMRDVLVEAEAPDALLLERVRDLLGAEGAPYEDEHQAAREHLIEVRYGGPDLESAARAMDVVPARLQAAHQEQVWRVAMLGFAPGFGYLEPQGPLVLDWMALERRSTPRARVPRGSVAIAAGMSAVYPQEMPGGWHLIGSSGVTLFDYDHVERPSLLAAGDLVRFIEVAP